MNRFPPRRILVPTDSCEPSLSALAAAKTLANRCGSRLELVYVQDIPQSLSGFDLDGSGLGTPSLARQMAEFGRWREECLKRRAAPFPSSRLRVRTVRGWPPGTLARLAQPEQTDLVVMGTHGYTGFGRAVFGSVAESVLRQAGVPVLAVHRLKKPLRLRKILIPCDMAAYAEPALRYGLAMARGLSAQAWVLYAAPKGADPEDFRLVLERRIRAAGGDRAAARRVILASGDPRRVILDEAKRGRFDLIVLSAHRKPFLRQQVLGSTAERILRYSPVPLLCVPSGPPQPAVKRKTLLEVVSGKIF